MHRWLPVAAALLCAIGAPALAPPMAPLLLPAGRLAAKPGAWVLPNGRTITPTGRMAELGSFPLGLALSPDGRFLVAANCGAGPQSLQVVALPGMQVVQTVPERALFSGVVFSRDGSRLWAAGGGSNQLLAFKFENGRLTPGTSIPITGYPAGVSLLPDGRTLAVACNLTRSVALVDIEVGREVGRISSGLFPFAVAPVAGGLLAAANWGDGTTALLDPASRTRVATIPTGGLPTALAAAHSGSLCYVANANSDTITVIDTSLRRRVSELAIRPYPGCPQGAIPTSLALSRDDRILYVACAGLNAVLCIDSKSGRAIAAMPTGWYPTAVLAHPGDGSLITLSSKGVGSGPNADGRYIGSMMAGFAASSPPPGSGKGLAEVAANNGYALRRGQPISRSGLPPIRHCVLIVRENRSFDQLLGDDPRVHGSPDLTLYGRAITPNLHALGERFALGDNFYSDGEVSDQGHQWTLGANCPDYVEKTWMAAYTGSGRLRDSTRAPVSYPAAGYAMDQCLRRGVSCRMYGDAVRIGPGGKPLAGLAAIVAPDYRGWDLDTPDTERAAQWLAEFRRGIFPAFSYIWLPNDHTAGTKPGSLSPRAMVADNDLATGRIIEAISRSKAWRDTAIFLCEDDSQDGRDHVDAHRNVLLIASPWVRRGAVTGRHYSQASIYATIERILGFPPMSQFDDLASPITDVWVSTPDLRPFQALPAGISTTERNTTQSAMWRESLQIDFDEPDADHSGRLEEALWREAIRTRR